ncbi:hypothetical protein PR001_g10410 [Phytophthora rubi]|uniref:Uncharacterized protein n=1 Tax=Phytophthora rubi TaxID=129364 RepID=A0A6A3MY52_9STRA|nr:hypothetical protein PR002_g10533 [Phytophthora rubi]KAE9032865.1 hypothetical protein PR001_g10410 [Phytophthora rubi]
MTTSTEVVQLSYWNFAVWWVIILVIHVVTGVYTALYAYCYFMLQDIYLNSYLESFQIGMPPLYHHAIAITHVTMSALHAMCIFLMLGGSLWQRSLAFTPWSSCNAETKRDKVETSRTNSMLLQSFTKVYSTISDRRGICGVNGDHFHAVLIVREVIETTLQTVQAYRMSMLLPRMLLNRFYVLLLVVNCWSSVVVHALFFRTDEARRRLVCITLNCILDFMTCMGVELIVLLSYAKDYNQQLFGFDDSLWRNDEWAARALNEFRMVVVVSWSDLASRALFALGLVMTTTNVKELLQRLPPRRNRINASHANAILVQQNLVDKSPLASAVPTFPEMSTRANRKILAKTNSYRAINLCTRTGRILLRLAHILFGVWGLLILGLHIHASMQPTLPQCFMQVRPWGASRPACYLVGLDCYTLAISGKKDEVEVKWGEFDSSTVVQLLIRHCPSLQVPDSISEFHGLHGIKVYNSTIVDWGESAALSNTNHPDIMSLYLARVNMTDGVLSKGFQSIDFPQNLNDIEFCVTNLHAVPDDLDIKWHKNALIQIEFSQLAFVPPVLLRLEPKYLALSGNQITDIPPEIFAIPTLSTLGLGLLNIQELPRNVTNLSPTLIAVFIDGTNISFFWPWVDKLITSEGWGVLLATDSPYCVDLVKIQDGTANAFSVPEYASILMDPSEANSPAIMYTVGCFGDVLPYYFIGLDDENMAISTPPPLVNPTAAKM